MSAWRNADQAPHAVTVALFWLTRWGMSAVNAEAENLASMHATRAACLASQVETLRAQVAKLNDSPPQAASAANAPFFRVG